MNENADYFDLKTVQGTRGYQKLQALWAHEYSEVMKGIQKTAARNNESHWRYQAGILKGFDLAIGQLDRALLQMEKDGEVPNPEEKTAEQIIKELRGDVK